MNINRCVLLNVILLSFSFSVLGQSNTISGKVIDNSNQELEFVKLNLLQLKDSSLVLSTQSDAKGDYRFANVINGNYLILAFLVGEDKVFSNSFSISNQDILNFAIILPVKTIQTEVISVKAQKQTVIVEDGKMTVDVENSIGNSGQNAIEVLRKAPGVSVDQDGKIQLKGKSGVQVMIDDKVMYMTEEQLANLLKSIPADQLKSIEIITSPSAKYDASGNAGIINIKLKKGAYEGLYGLANGSLGTGIYHKSNAGVNITYKKKKYSSNIGYQYSNNQQMNEWSSDRTNSDSKSTINSVYNINRYIVPYMFNSLNTKNEYHVNDNTSLTLDVNGSYGAYGWNGKSSTYLYNKNNTLSSRYLSNDIGQTKWGNFNSNIGFKHSLDTLGNDVSGDFGFGRYDGNEFKNQVIQNYDSLGVDKKNPFVFHKTIKSYSNQLNGKIDYTKKITKASKFETGTKYIYSQNYEPNEITIDSSNVITDRSNHFLYELNVFAVYANASTKINKWDLQVGLRFEQTLLKGTTTLDNSSFQRNFGDLFPSGSITFSATEKTSYSLMYSRRIDRPSGDQLNPVQNIIDPYTTWGGDPLLKPMYTDNVEFTHSLFGGVLISTLNYSYISNPIAWVNKVIKSENKIISGPRNLDFQKNYGLSVSLNKSFVKWWESNNNFLMNINQFVGESDFGVIDNQAKAWGVKSTQSFKLPKELSIELSGFYDSRSVDAFDYNNENWQLNLAIQKKIWDKKATIKLAFNDMFYTFFYVGHSEMGTTKTITSYKWDNRTVIFSLSYKFGKKLLVTAQ